MFPPPLILAFPPLRRHPPPATRHSPLATRHSRTLAPPSQLISVISLLSADTPNTDSPANIDAAKEVREDIKAYRRKVRRLASRSAEEYF